MEVSERKDLMQRERVVEFFKKYKSKSGGYVSVLFLFKTFSALWNVI